MKETCLSGQLSSDMQSSPYPNDNAARASNNGALPQISRSWPMQEPVALITCMHYLVDIMKRPKAKKLGKVCITTPIIRNQIAMPRR